MTSPRRILIIQTAFLGDVVLTLPLAQVVKDFFEPAEVDMLVVPRAAGLLHPHPALNDVIEYDKRGSDKGISGFLRILRLLRSRKYEVGIVPHRSIRSALLCLLAGIPLRIGFRKSAGWFLFNRLVPYRDHLHEVDRNLSLLEAVGIDSPSGVVPQLYPSEQDRDRVDRLLMDLKAVDARSLLAIAPGTIWNTKRWLKERFATLAEDLSRDGHRVVLIGGKEDEGLCHEIVALAPSAGIIVAAGRLTPLQSAELLRRCALLVSNDSAPMHLAVAVGTPVVAIFGATVPAFGFAPIGPHDAVVETRGLPCRPCSIHGGDKCPIETFECMKAITHERVAAKVREALEKSRRLRGGPRAR
jgi:heptosyltransferase-2